MSKGHKRRPQFVDDDDLAQRWARVLPRRSIPRCAKCGRRHTPACVMTATEALDAVVAGQVAERSADN